MKQVKLMLGDNMESLKNLPDNSVDSIVSDPPYGLSFMNKKWDYDVPSVEFWEEVFRVLKPGGHILSFGGTRTYHRMVVNIEDAGFEIRDQIQWIYGSGFPKSHNIGKAVDKRGGESIGWFGEWLAKWRKENNIPQSKIAELFPSKTGGLTGCVSNWELGNNLPTNEQFNLICKTFDLPFNSLQEAEREFIGTKTSGIGKSFGDGKWNTGEYGSADVVDITKGSSKYEGWGTNLKPANEPICVARKPLSEKTIAENVLKWGTGGINIDGCRIGFDMNDTNPATNPLYRHQNSDKYKQVTDHGQKEGVNVKFTNSLNPPSEEGRFPANIILECICDEVIKGEKGEVIEHNGTGGIWNEGSKEPVGRTYNDKGDTHTNPMCPCRLLDEQSGVTKTKANLNYKHNKTNSDSDVFQSRGTYTPREDKGGASRFFYQAKVSKKERNMGLDGFEKKVIEGRDQGQDERNVAYKARPSSRANTHPTVKPVALMAYLCRLITPQGGIVLDPFMGSGSTGIAAQLEGFKFCGMEMDEDYFKISEARIENFEMYREFVYKNK